MNKNRPNYRQLTKGANWNGIKNLQLDQGWHYCRNGIALWNQTLNISKGASKAGVLSFLIPLSVLRLTMLNRLN